MDKQGRLMAKEEGVNWAWCKKKKGHSKINNNICCQLLTAFYNYPHIIVSPNLKDTIMVRNKEGVKVPVRKIMLMVRLGTIFSDIVHANLTIRNKVSKCAFQDIISALSCVRCFNNLHKTFFAAVHCALACRQCPILCRLNAVLFRGRSQSIRKINQGRLGQR